MEYYEDAFQSEQDSQVEHCVYYALMFCGDEWITGSYEMCEDEMNKLIKEHAKDGVSRSDFRIDTRSCSI